MKEVFLVKAENKSRAEAALKGDEKVSRGSILIRESSSLGIGKGGVFFVLDAPENAVKKAAILLKGIGEKYKKKDEVIKKIDEETENATQGFGNILG